MDNKRVSFAEELAIAMGFEESTDLPEERNLIEHADGQDEGEEWLDLVHWLKIPWQKIQWQWEGLWCLVLSNKHE